MLAGGLAGYINKSLSNITQKHTKKILSVNLKTTEESVDFSEPNSKEKIIYIHWEGRKYC